MNYLTRKIKAASERGRKKANARWAKDRAARQFLAKSDPVKFTGCIVKRIIVIDREKTACEIVFFDFDRYSDRQRKLRAARALSLPA